MQKERQLKGFLEFSAPNWEVLKFARGWPFPVNILSICIKYNHSLGLESEVGEERRIAGRVVGKTK